MLLLQTRTTHGAQEAVEASVLFADMLADAISVSRCPRSSTPRSGSFSPKLEAIASVWPGAVVTAMGSSEPGMSSTHSNAALWAVSRTTNFRSAVLLAANLGDDADTTAAVAGQLAGSLYGSSTIPESWMAKLAWREQIERTAAQLID